MGFDAYMEIALYDPELGFFAQSGRGPGTGDESDFVTSPEISPDFGTMLVEHANRLWEAMDRPKHLSVMEAGGGRGTLAHSFLNAASTMPWFDGLEYQLMDRCGAGAGAGGDKRDSRIRIIGEAIEGPVEGLIFANELLDNIAEKLWRYCDGHWRELCVGLDGDELVFIEGAPPSTSQLDMLEQSRAHPKIGDVIVGSTSIADWVGRSALSLRRGELLLIDYPDPPADAPMGGLRTFSGHEKGENPLDAPGERDITLPVNWAEVDRAARSAGLRVMPAVSQAQWLADLGVESLLSELRESELAATGDGGTMEAMSHRNRRMRVLALTDPQGLGAFTVFRARRGC